MLVVHACARNLLAVLGPGQITIPVILASKTILSSTIP